MRCCNTLKYLISVESQYDNFSDDFIEKVEKFVDELQSEKNYKKIADFIKQTIKKVSFSKTKISFRIRIKLMLFTF